MEYKEQKQNSRFVYAVSVLLVVIVLAIGISTMNNFDKMESVQENAGGAINVCGFGKSGGSGK